MVSPPPDQGLITTLPNGGHCVVVSSVPRRGRDGDGADRTGQRDEVMLPRSRVAMNMRLGTIPRPVAVPGTRLG